MLCGDPTARTSCPYSPPSSFGAYHVGHLWHRAAHHQLQNDNICTLPPRLHSALAPYILDTPASYPNGLIVSCLFLRQVAIYGRVHIYQCFIELLHQLHRAFLHATPYLTSHHPPHSQHQLHNPSSPSYLPEPNPSLLPSPLLLIAFLAYGIALTAESGEIRPVVSDQPDFRKRNGSLLCTV